MVTREQYIDDVLDRLGDLDQDVWSREEIGRYVDEGYDQFTRRTECLFDIFVIPNVPHGGNWQTHFERYMASQKPGFGVTDEPSNWSGGDSRNLGVGGRVGGALQGPAAFTSPPESRFVGETGAAEDVPSTVYGGRIPDTTVKILRVTYDYKTLVGVGSQQMRRMDATYETRTGDPQWFVYDKDGLFFIRVVQAATGNAAYPEATGARGTRTQSVESVSGLYNALTNYWKLEEASGGMLDSVGSITLTDSGATQVTGKNNYGQELGFENEISGSISSWAANAVSFSVWFKASSLADDFGSVFGGHDTGTDRLVALVYDSFAFNGNSLTLGSSGRLVDTWYHLVLTWDGVSTWKLYVNGSLDLTHTDTAYAGSEFYLENLSPVGTHTFDELARFNKALSAEEVSALYNNGDGAFYPELGDIDVDEIVSDGALGYGILRYVTDGSDNGVFPAGGPWGTPTQIHPQTANIFVELIRTGRKLTSQPSEIPDAYDKYVTYFAMAQALNRSGPGHDEKMGAHFASRFEMGVSLMNNKRNMLQRERMGRIGGVPAEEPFAMGLPQPPSNYGEPRR